ncbi:MAG: hypothetical protein ACXVA4_14145, partial [Ktedonobacterales bacterium]
RQPPCDDIHATHSNDAPERLRLLVRRAKPIATALLRCAAVIAVGFLPFFLWECFSLWYYGVLFPNTAYAKLNTGIPAPELLHQGLLYLAVSSIFDVLLALVIVTAFLLTLFNRNGHSMPLIVGMAAYLLYTVKVGGDFMAGRFLTPVLFIAVAILMHDPFRLAVFKQLFPTANVRLTGVVFGILLVAILVPDSRWLPDSAGSLFLPGGLADERSFSVAATGLFRINVMHPIPNHPWAAEGAQLRASSRGIAVFRNVGYYGFMAGPNVYIVDTFALNDPLLARLPSQRPWRIGHFERSLPDGYVETLGSGSNKITDAHLARYYDKLRIVTRGNLWDPERLIVIWKLNTGAYNYLLDAYIRNHPTS